MLKSVSGIGKAILNKKFKQNIPKTLLNVCFDCFSLNFNSEQYRDILLSLSAIVTAQRALPYRKYRPEGEKILPVDMFRFAVTCYLSEIRERNRRQCWKFISERRASRKEYIDLYVSKLMTGKAQEAGAKSLADLERRMSFEDIAHYRSMARSVVKKSKAAILNKPGGDWFWGWLGHKNAATVRQSRVVGSLIYRAIW